MRLRVCLKQYLPVASETEIQPNQTRMRIKIPVFAFLTAALLLIVSFLAGCATNNQHTKSAGNGAKTILPVTNQP
jgi:hypothetical protein